VAIEKSPAFQFYPKDWLTSETVRRMSMEQRGVYITLLCHQWLEGSLPADMGTLARVSQVSPKLLRGSFREALGKTFLLSGDGRLRNPRLELERVKQLKFRALCAEAGRRGGRPKKGTPFPGESSSSSTPVVPPYSPPKGGRSRTRAHNIPGGSGCAHTPRCRTSKACIERTLAEARRKRAAS